MKSAGISEAKNGLSELLADVRRGETVLITRRGNPVARLDRYDAMALPAGDATDALVRRGVADPPRAPLDVERFLAGPVPRAARGCSASRLLVAERGDGR